MSSLPRSTSIVLDAAVLGFILLSGCDSSSPTTSGAALNQTWTGHTDISKMGASATAHVAVGSHLFTISGTGDFTITLPPSTAGASSRVLGDAMVDTARLIVQHGDTLDTLRNWALVQSHPVLDSTTVIVNPITVAMATGSYANKVVEAVWWSNDSVAHVVRIPNTTSANYYSSSVYTLYDEAAFRANAVKYSVFLRVKDSAKQIVPVGVTYITAITAQVASGVLAYTDTFFHAPILVDTTYAVSRYATVSANHSVSALAYSSTASMLYDTLLLGVSGHSKVIRLWTLESDSPGDRGES